MSTVTKSNGKSGPAGLQNYALVAAKEFQQGIMKRGIMDTIAEGIERLGYFKGEGDHIEAGGDYWFIKDDTDAMWGNTHRTKFLRLEFKEPQAYVRSYGYGAENDTVAQPHTYLRFYTNGAKAEKDIERIAARVLGEAGFVAMKEEDGEYTLLSEIIAREGIDLASFQLAKPKKISHRKEVA